MDAQGGERDLEDLVFECLERLESEGEGALEALCNAHPGQPFPPGDEDRSSGTASYPGPGEFDVSVRGAIPAAGAARYCQGWYRNSAAFCTISTFNLTNGLRVQWIP